MIKDNLCVVMEAITRAAEKVGRRGEDVELVAVTKMVDAARINEAIEAGVRAIGENRVQEAATKYNIVVDGVRWHFIGHLQRNKAKRAAGIFSLIHSLDSISLSQEINRHAVALGKQVEALVEVNISGEETRFGLRPEELIGFLKEASVLKNLRISGLMTMSPFTDEPESSRAYFRELRLLSEEVASHNIENIEMKYLSMGMSQDFETAIEEGANMVRVGTAIFGSRPPA
ncbi:MAG: Alanine racemase [Syntrophomonadaceae bacterium]|nr:Alanine racemase [Bacillota bacterium]